jgi:hypothetical protein
MKKFIIGALALTVTNTIAMAEMNNFYVGGGIVYEKIDGTDDAGKAFALHAGKEIEDNFGVEIRVSKTFDESEYTGAYPWVGSQWVDGNYNSKVKIDALTVATYGTYKYNPLPEITIIPKIGLNYTSVKTTVSSGIYTRSDTDTDTSLSYGLDLKYNINPTFITYIGFTKIASDTQHITVGLERRF